MHLFSSRHYLISFVLIVLTLCAITASYAVNYPVVIVDDQFTVNGHVNKIKGTNYYPMNYMWASLWNVPLSTVQSDADRLKSIGVNAVRILVPYSNGEWNGPNIPADRLQKLEDMVNIFGQRGIRSCVTLFDWEASFPAETDSKWTNDHVTYITTIVNRLKNNPYVFMWDVKNEPDHPENLNYNLYHSNPQVVVDSWNDPRTVIGKKDKIISWLQRACSKVKNLDEDTPVSVGLRWYENLPDIIDDVDIAICHTYYPAWVHPLDQIYYIRSFTSKPILFEEFGYPTGGGQWFTEWEQYRCYEAHVAAINDEGITGGLQWMTYDGGNPDSSHEAHFGLWRRDYTLKPAGEHYRDYFTVYPFPTNETVPPAKPGLSATPDVGVVHLSWNNPSNTDVRGVMIRCSTTGYPASPSDGTLVIDREGRPGTAGTFDHVTMTGGSTYYYSAFAYDTSFNYSVAATASVIPEQPETYTCAGLRNSADDTAALITGAIITAVFQSEGHIYITDSDRSGGIRVVCPTDTLKTGDVVDVLGKVTTRSMNGIPCERQVISSMIEKKSSTNPVRPLLVNCASIGGRQGVPNIPEINDASGPSNFGLLVKVVGRVVHTDGPDFFISDGSRFSDSDGQSGVKIKMPAVSAAQVGDFVSVTGVVQGDVPSGANANRRCIGVQSLNDLQIISLKASIGGFVKNAWDEPISGATIIASPGGSFCTSAADGSYVVPNLNQAIYSVTASASGYQQRTYSGISVQEGSRTPLNITLLNGKARISGTVRDIYNTPVSGATVTASGKQAVTGSDGTYVLKDVTAGTVSVSVSKADYLTNTQSYQLPADQTTVLDLVLTPVERLLNGNFSGGFTSTGTSLIGNYWKGVWNGTTLNGFWDSFIGGNPSHCQAVTAMVNGFEIGIAQEVTNLTPGSSYTFTAESKKTSTGNEVYIGVRPGTGLGTQIGITGTAFTNTTNAWVTQSVSGTVDATGSLTVYLWVKRQSGATSAVYFDNASLKVW